MARFRRRPARRSRRSGRNMKRRSFRGRRKLRTRAPTRRHAGRIVMRSLGQPFPQSFFTKLKYQEIISGDSDILQWSNTGTAPPFTTVARWASDMNYPRGATDPGQPRAQYYNQFAELYRQYRVLGNRIKIEFIPRLTPQENDINLGDAQTYYAPSGDYYPIDCVVAPYRQGAITPGNLMEISAQPMARRVTYNSANKNRPIKNYVSSKRMSRFMTDIASSNAIQTRWRSLEANEDVLSSSTYGPHWYWLFMISNLGHSNVGWAIRVTMTYYVQFSNHRYQDLSYEPGEGIQGYMSMPPVVPFATKKHDILPDDTIYLDTAREED